MTGYSRNIHEENSIKIEIEIRTVNGRFLNLNSKVSPALNAYESNIRKIISEYLTRGHVTLSIQYTNFSENSNYHLDTNALQYYYYILAQEASKLWIHPPQIDSLLTLPGIISTTMIESISQEKWKIVEELLHKTLKQLNEMRETEGKNLSLVIQEYSNDLQNDLTKLEEYIPTLRNNYQKRIQNRLEELSKLDKFTYKQEDILREVALFCDKSDVSEEIARCKSHLQQFQENINKITPVGKTLEFILQEIVREVTTITSKANDFETSNIVVHIKSTVEKIREQIQNIE